MIPSIPMFVVTLKIRNLPFLIVKSKNSLLAIVSFCSIVVFMYHQSVVLLLLKFAMTPLTAGHFGYKKTISLISRDFWWPSISFDVKNYTRSCETCCRSKPSLHKPYGFLHPLDISELPWSSIFMDFITDLPSSDGYNYIFVVVDRLSKMIHLFPFRNISSAIETAECFVDSIFKLHGLHSEIVSDRGS